MNRKRDKSWLLKGDTLRTDLKGQGIGDVSHQGGSAFAEEPRRQERNKFTHTYLALKQNQDQKNTESAHSNSFMPL